MLPFPVCHRREENIVDSRLLRRCKPHIINRKALLVLLVSPILNIRKYSYASRPSRDSLPVFLQEILTQTYPDRRGLIPGRRTQFLRIILCHFRLHDIRRLQRHIICLVSRHIQIPHLNGIERISQISRHKNTGEKAQLPVSLDFRIHINIDSACGVRFIVLRKRHLHPVLPLSGISRKPLLQNLRIALQNLRRSLL